MDTRLLIRIVKQVLRLFIRKGQRPRTRQRSGTRHPHRVAAPKSLSIATKGTSQPQGLVACDYPITDKGLPPLQYSPKKDGNPDPGEVVWTWVPFEEDPSVGKDRPVLILCRVSAGYLGLPLTSQNHTQGGGRGTAWLSIGSGSWDRQGRESFVRLDRVLLLPSHSIRREGGALAQERYEKVAQALKTFYT